MRIAMQEHPDALFVIGNAPTALFEVCDGVLDGRINPVGIVGVPVGFVNVIESKLKLQSLKKVPYIIIKGRNGGSNVAASIVNAAFTFDKSGFTTAKSPRTASS